MGIGDRDLDFKMSLKILYNKDFLKDLKTRLVEKSTKMEEHLVVDAIMASTYHVRLAAKTAGRFSLRTKVHIAAAACRC